MKKFLPLLILPFLLLGFGCQNNGAKTPIGWTTYEAVEYGFSAAYPGNMEMKERSLDQQDSSYAGLNGKFFASLRDTEREDSVTTLALFYAIKDVDFEKFSEALVASDPEFITIKETSNVSQGGIEMKKIVSTTALGLDKTHYLFVDGENLIIISVVLSEEEAFQPVFETIQKLK